MIKPIKFDDSLRENLIWLDWNDTNAEELNNFVCANFDVANVPHPDEVNLSTICTNYYVTYFCTLRSSTGYATIFTNKDRNIYKSRVGYKTDINGKQIEEVHQL